MVGTLGKIAAFFGSKSNLTTASAYTSSVSVYKTAEDIPDDTASFKRRSVSWSSLRLHRKIHRDQNRVANNLGQNVITSPPKSEATNGSIRRKPPPKSPPTPAASPPTNNNNINNNNNTCKNNSNNVATLAHSPSAKTAPNVATSSAVAAPSVDTARAQTDLRHAAKAVESLSVLIQYLTCDLDGFSAPVLKKELSKLKEEWLKTKLELEETQVSYRRLEDEASSQRIENKTAIVKLSEESKQEIAQLHNEHSQQLEQLKTQHKEELEKLLSKTHEDQLSELTRRLEEQATELQKQFTAELDCLQRGHAEENKKAKEDFDAYKEESEARLKKVIEEAKQREKILGERLNEVEQQHDALREQSRSIVDGMQNDKDSKVQVTSQYCRKLQDEVDSLRTVLDIRHAELQDLRKQNECLQSDISEMPLIRQKLLSAQARVEDLSVQLQRKGLFEKQLSEENRMLSESLHCESEKKQKLTYAVEELQYKLKKTQEVASHLASIKDLSSLVDSSVLNASETMASSTPLDPKANKLCRNLNKEYEPKGRPQAISTAKKPTCQPDDTSEPKSPKVISVVKKSDSVSWVLEIDDPSDDVVSMLVRKQSGRVLSQPNSSVSSPVRQDQGNRTEPKPRLHSQSSMNKKSKKPALRPRSISFNGEKVQKSESPSKEVSNSNAPEDASCNSQYITANNWEELPGNESPVWDKNAFPNGNHYPESKFSPAEISGASSLKVMDPDDAINFDSDFEFFEKSEHFEIVDAEKPGIQITGGEDFASPKFSTSSLTSESSIHSNLSSNHYDCENAGISLEHEEYLLINSNCKNTNKITLVNRLSPEKRKPGNSSYGETSDDDISSSSKYDDDGSSASASDYLEKDCSSQEDYVKEYSHSEGISEKEIIQNGEMATNSVVEKGENCDDPINAVQKQKSLENLVEKSQMKDKRSISFDTGRQAIGCNYPSFITLEKISFINKSLESSGTSHSKSFSGCDERKNAKYTNGIETAANVKMNQHTPRTENIALSVDS